MFSRVLERRPVGTYCRGARVGLSVVLLLVGLLAVPTFAESVWYVSVDGSDAAPGTRDEPLRHVQTAFDLAVDGDRILVLPGRYVENVDFLGKEVVLRSDAGPRVTILDGSEPEDVSRASVVLIEDEVGPGAVVDGFTLTGGRGTRFNLPMVGNIGGGIAVSRLSRPTLVNNIITGNSANSGGGIGLERSTALIANNVIYGNRAIGLGGGVVGLVGHTEPIRLVNNTIVGNQSTDGGGVLGYAAALEMTNCIVVDNIARTPEIWWIQIVPTVTHSLVGGGWPGAGNLEGDPMFCNASAGDFRLQAGSICIDAGRNEIPTIKKRTIGGGERLLDGDMDEIDVVDIGAYEVAVEIAARYGTVQGAEGGLADVLFVNGSAGDEHRVVSIGIDEALDVALTPAPAGPTPAAYVLYAWRGEPDRDSVSVQPFGLGMAGFATPLTGAASRLVATWNNLGYEYRLGAADRESVPAPWTLLELPKGVGQPARITLQGFIADEASRAAGPLSLTNAVVIDVR